MTTREASRVEAREIGRGRGDSTTWRRHGRAARRIGSARPAGGGGATGDAGGPLAAPWRSAARLLRSWLESHALGAVAAPWTACPGPAGYVAYVGARRAGDGGGDASGDARVAAGRTPPAAPVAGPDGRQRR